MTLALPAAPAPAPQRQVLVGTALAVVAATMLVGGMLAVWVLQRTRVVDAGERFPEGYTIAEVPTNIMLITAATLCVFAQWAVYAAKRSDRLNVGLALGVTGVLAVAFINAQAFTWFQMEVELAEGGYAVLFYAITGTIVALAAIGIIFTVVAAFRYLGGRAGDTEVIAANALFWYFFTAAYAAVWFVVYVTK